MEWGRRGRARWVERDGGGMGRKDERKATGGRTSETRELSVSGLKGALGLPALRCSLSLAIAAILADCCGPPAAFAPARGSGLCLWRPAPRTRRRCKHKNECSSATIAVRRVWREQKVLSSEYLIRTSDIVIP